MVMVVWVNQDFKQDMVTLGNWFKDEIFDSV